MKILVPTLAAAFLTSSPSAGDELKPDRVDKPFALTLKVGDPAPALTVTRWLSETSVPRFEPGKVYVIDFWAPWCAPCIRHMPHLAALQARYKDRGVTVIGFTSRTIRGKSDNSEEKAAAFVKRRGPMLKYTFAYGDDETTTDAWLKAASQTGFGTFVVDKTGRIAYMGSYIFVGMALPKALAGEESAKVIGDEMANVDADYRTACAALERDGNPDAFLRALSAFEAKYPPLADSLPANGLKLDILLKRGNASGGQEYAKRLVTKAIEQDDVFLLEFAHFLLHDKTGNKDLTTLAVKADEAAIRIDGGTNASSLLRLAEAHSFSGNSAKAKDFARRALVAAAGEAPEVRQEIEKEARRLGVE